MAFDPISAGVAIGGGILRGISGSKAASDNKRHWREGRKQLHNRRFANADLLGLQEEFLQKRLGKITEGYTNARGSLARYGDSAKRGASDVATQRSAGLGQSLASRGLTNTTVYDAGLRGIDSDLVRSLADIDEMVGSAFADLDIGQATAEAGALGDLSNFYGGKAAFQSNFDLSLVDYLSGRQAVGSDLTGLGSLAGSLEGGFDWLKDLFGGGGAPGSVKI